VGSGEGYDRPSSLRLTCSEQLALANYGQTASKPAADAPRVRPLQLQAPETEGLFAWASFSSVNWGEKHYIRISVTFRLYLVKII
jgi:hypothetical protein